MARPAPLTRQPILPSSLHVAEARFAGADLGRLFFGQVAEAGQLGMAEQGVVVEAHLGVQGQQLGRRR